MICTFRLLIACDLASCQDRADQPTGWAALCPRRLYGAAMTTIDSGLDALTPVDGLIVEPDRRRAVGDDRTGRTASTR